MSSLCNKTCNGHHNSPPLALIHYEEQKAISYIIRTNCVVAQVESVKNYVTASIRYFARFNILLQIIGLYDSIL